MFWQGKRVLITGVTGFVGSHLAAHLLAEGAEVYGLVRRRADGQMPVNVQRLALETSLRMLEGDLADITSLIAALRTSQPAVVFHLAAQSFVARSFTSPLESFQVNTLGTVNLLEAMRMEAAGARLVFAGSSEEYGLVFASQAQYEAFCRQRPGILPERVSVPELPVAEDNPLRPMSPYGVSKVHGDHMVRNYYYAYGLRGTVSRAFNTEGAGRGPMFVTSTVARQVARLAAGQADKIVIGNVNALRDWSHIEDIVEGYCLLAEKGAPGAVYNQGSQRTNSVLTYILLALETVGFRVERIRTFRNGKRVDAPLTRDQERLFGTTFEKTRVDMLLLQDELNFTPQDEGIWVETDRGEVPVLFDPARFRPAEVPVLLADTARIARLGFVTHHTLADIVADQVAEAFTALGVPRESFPEGLQSAGR